MADNLAPPSFSGGKNWDPEPEYPGRIYYVFSINHTGKSDLGLILIVYAR